MRFITGIGLAGWLLMGAAPAAQETPYVKDISLTIIPSTDEPVPLQRRTVTATLVNAHPIALAAWALDLIDSDGRPVSSSVDDYVELPSAFLATRGERRVETGWVSRGGVPGPKPVALVFRAGIDSNGRGVGDPETVEWMRKSRASREERGVADKTTISGVTAQSPVPTTYWPGVEWRRATPESQGLDSQALASAIAQVREKQWGIHSLLVIRHGFVVADADFYPYRSTAPHDVASVTKTITSTLTGVAVANNLLRLDQPVLSFFPNESPADADERKRAITVENLLRMESGLDCGFLPGEQELEKMKRSPNWVAFTLALPMKYDRGTRPSYCSPGYHLLGSVIGAAAKTTELDFGRKYLFDPLDIKDVVWGADPQGRSHGWGDSHFYPRDIAKLGYLYLHGGAWKGQADRAARLGDDVDCAGDGAAHRAGWIRPRVERDERPERPAIRRRRSRRPVPDRLARPRHDCRQHRRRQHGATDGVDQGSGQGRSAPCSQ